MRSFSRDGKAATVIFGTLMIILVTIVMASVVTVMLSNAMREHQEQQELTDDKNNENLTILSVSPEDLWNSNCTPLNSNSTPLAAYTGFDFLISNNGLKDDIITARYINDKPILYYEIKDNSGNYQLENGKISLHDGNESIEIPSHSNKRIHFGAITIHGNVTMTGGSIISSNNSPGSIYPDITSSGYALIGNDVYNTTGRFSYDTNTGSLSFINYSTLPDDVYDAFYIVFPNNELYNATDNNDPYKTLYDKTKPVKVDLVTSRQNLFSKLFALPVPVASMQYISVNTTGGQDLVLDASGSTATNGFIKDYIWYIKCSSCSNPNILHGIKVPCSFDSGKSYDIGLTVIDNYGMSAELKDYAGNITI